MQDRIDRLERGARDARKVIWMGRVLAGILLAFLAMQVVLLYVGIVSLGGRPLGLIATGALCLVVGLVCLVVVARALTHEAATLAEITEQIHWERVH